MCYGSNSFLLFREAIGRMKEGEEEKTKTYSALIWTDKTIQKEHIAFLDNIKVCVALFANLCSTLPGVSEDSLYTHAHRCICFFLLLVFYQDYMDFCNLFSLPPSHSSLFCDCYVSTIVVCL